jgi:hypothetical protein
MIAILSGLELHHWKGKLYYIDNDNKSIALKHSFSGCGGSIEFTSDDKYITFNNNNNNNNRLTFRDITTGREAIEKSKHII